MRLPQWRCILPRNGTGTFVRETPVATGTVAWANTKAAGDVNITTTDHDFHDQDIALALTQSIAVDGQTVITANLPMSTFRHTGVGNAAARTDYASAADIQDSSLIFAIASGTDTYTATLAPALAAYVDGGMYAIRIPNANTISTPTLNLNGLGAKTITTANGAALSAGALPAGFEAIFRYVSGTGKLNLINGSTGNIAIQIKTSSGTYTPTPGMKNVLWFLTGGAGSGSSNGGARGGGAGETRVGLSTAAAIGASQSVTIGAGGTGTTTVQGADGTASSLGAISTANPGKGTGNSFSGQSGGSGGSGGLFGITGGDGIVGAGGASYWGGGAESTSAATGWNGRAYGAGGGPNNNTGVGASGNGAAGVFFAIEFL